MQNLEEQFPIPASAPHMGHARVGEVCFSDGSMLFVSIWGLENYSQQVQFRAPSPCSNVYTNQVKGQG